ncbi:hypothetical protein CXB51_011110 [Gossypium anomalum]|uniref:Reverse transcriptase Ty1/copia-type domain-containing protein n=1 Tax=Gossypium anomalum TaxID=47600 RepID=A0A8J5YP34_9ROSI|nr:hypothetical protein CXB51_011110 [Gossypium anomalum]
MKHARWRGAMQKEIRALEDNDTWFIETLPPENKVLGSTWVYKIKYNFDGNIERLKAKLIVFGNHQELLQMDVHNTFLHGDLNEEVYMKLSLGFSPDKLDMGNDSAALKTFKGYFSSCFHNKDLGVLKYFLGIEHSLIGWLVFLGQSPISWKTKKEHIVSRSFAETEYRFMASITCELKWLKDLLLSLGVYHPKVIHLFCDSQSALHIAQNPVFHEHTKLIKVGYHFVRDAIQDGLIAPSYVSTFVQLADIFTKALSKPQFEYLLSKLGIYDLHVPT